MNSAVVIKLVPRVNAVAPVRILRLFALVSPSSDPDYFVLRELSSFWHVLNLADSDHNLGLAEILLPLATYIGPRCSITLVIRKTNSGVGDRRRAYARQMSAVEKRSFAVSTQTAGIGR